MNQTDTEQDVFNLRPEIVDQELKEKADRIFEKLDAYYPEHKVFSLDAIDVTLRERLNKLYKDLRYSSLEEMYADYGYELISGEAVKEIRNCVLYTPGNEPDK